MNPDKLKKVPFPSAESLPEPLAQSPLASSSNSVPVLIADSHATSSSKLTSSDKLSALPSPSQHVNPIRTARPSYLGLQSPQRNFRHSLDASASLPSFSTTRELDLLSLDVWGAIPSVSRSENNSADKETPVQRRSIDSDRGSHPTMRSVGQAFSRLTRSNDPRQNSAVPAETHSRSASHSRSRATSPLRIFQQWSSGIHRANGHRGIVEEPFVPVNPFKVKGRMPFKFCIPTTDVEAAIESVGSSSSPYECDDILPIDSFKTFLSDAYIFLTDSLPRQIYLNFLLRLPAMYFTRISRIFQDAEVSRPDIQRIIDATCTDSQVVNSALQGLQRNIHHTPHISLSPYPPQGLGASFSETASAIGLNAQVGAAPASVVHMPLPFPDEWTPASVSPSLIRFKHSWEFFIDSLLREWKTLNLVSALLASAILTIFQVQEAAEDPVTRTFAFLSLICALMSLSYGCMYIVRFGTMRSMFRASKWAEEARKTNTGIWWNVWVFLAMPAVWMAWSMILFLSAILSFVWRSGSEEDLPERPPMRVKVALGTRIAITVVFGLGLVYLVMIIKTLKRYGGSHGGGMQGLLRAGMSTTMDGMDAGAPRGGHATPVIKEEGNTVNRVRTGLREPEIGVNPERRGRERRRRKSDPERMNLNRSTRTRKEELVGDEFGLKEKAMLGELLGLGHVGDNSQTDSGISLELKKRDS